MRTIATRIIRNYYDIFPSIENEAQYEAALKRVEYLMLNTPEDLSENDLEMFELILLGNLVADYEEEHFPIGKPSLIDSAIVLEI